MQLITAFLLGFITPFATVPLVLNAADAFGLYNISDDRPLAFRIEYFVDVDKYYNVLLIHSFFGTIGYALVTLAINCMMLAYVMHQSGLCEVLRYLYYKSYQLLYHVFSSTYINIENRDKYFKYYH